MTHPLRTLMTLNAITLKLDKAQDEINLGRYLAPDSQLVQLALDRRQTEVDNDRAKVEMALLTISSLN